MCTLQWQSSLISFNYSKSLSWKLAVRCFVVYRTLNPTPTNYALTTLFYVAVPNPSSVPQHFTVPTNYFLLFSSMVGT
jgi:hypothetical protein